MSIKSPPGFFSDWLRHDLGTAFRKRWGSWVVAEQTWTYKQILALSPLGLKILFGQALDAGEHHVACWVIESWQIQEEREGACWLGLMEVLAERLEPAALLLLRQLTEYIIASELLNLEDPYHNYLLGQFYGQQALSAKGVSKSTLQSNKKTSLVFLGKARERLDEAAKSGKSLVFAGGRLPAADLVLAAAACHEQIIYLQWKGERTAATSE